MQRLHRCSNPGHTRDHSNACSITNSDNNPLALTGGNSHPGGQSISSTHVDRHPDPAHTQHHAGGIPCFRSTPAGAEPGECSVRNDATHPDRAWKAV